MFSCYHKSFFPLPLSSSSFLLFTPSHLMSTGIAVDKNGLIYFVDGTTIRKVDQNGIISTFLGSNDLTSARPLTCDNSMDVNQVTYTLKCQTVVSSARGLLRACHSATSCPPTLQFAHPWLIINMQHYITAYIYTYAVKLISFHEW